jgi:hypothetical protein
MVIPLKTKTTASLQGGFQQIMDHMGIPEQLNGDQEFNKAWVKK